MHKSLGVLGSPASSSYVQKAPVHQRAVPGSAKPRGIHPEPRAELREVRNTGYSVKSRENKHRAVKKKFGIYLTGLIYFET